VRRRTFLIGPLALLGSHAFAAVEYPPVTLGHLLEFPRDHGAHPAFRTEWWYVTGWLREPSGRELGFQVTFFRYRPGIAENNPSAFAPRQLLFAHAAIADPAIGRLVKDQRAARAGFGLAEAWESYTNVRMDDWSLAFERGAYRARIPAREFTFEATFEPTRPILLHGEGGYSRRGPRPSQASYYYSRPQLAVAGKLERGGVTLDVKGEAWLDHEWSNEFLAPEAAGWDWLGLNLADAGALMASRMRAKSGGDDFWAAATLRRSNGRVLTFAENEVRFTPVRLWRSPRTEVEYPVAMHVRVGELEWTIDPLMDDQELDARESTGTIYWEGAVRAKQNDRASGRGYLELTGYWKPLRF
jgi:predicted secreted hydrolase